MNAPGPDADHDGLRGHHDLGGVSRFQCEAVDTAPHALEGSDREIDARRKLLGAKGLVSVDELRRGIEAMPEADYLRLPYYGRWIRSIAAILIEKGVFTDVELRAALERQ